MYDYNFLLTSFLNAAKEQVFRESWKYAYAFRELFNLFHNRFLPN